MQIHCTPPGYLCKDTKINTTYEASPAYFQNGSPDDRDSGTASLISFRRRSTEPASARAPRQHGSSPEPHLLRPARQRQSRPQELLPACLRLSADRKSAPYRSRGSPTRSTTTKTGIGKVYDHLAALRRAGGGTLRAANWACLRRAESSRAAPPLLLGAIGQGACRGRSPGSSRVVTESLTGLPVRMKLKMEEALLYAADGGVKILRIGLKNK